MRKYKVHIVGNDGFKHKEIVAARSVVQALEQVETKVAQYTIELTIKASVEQV